MKNNCKMFPYTHFYFYLFLLFLIFCSPQNLMATNIPNGIRIANQLTQNIQIHSFKGYKIVQTDPLDQISSGSPAFLRVELELIVEGNICGSPNPIAYFESQQKADRQQERAEFISQINNDHENKVLSEWSLKLFNLGSAYSNPIRCNPNNRVIRVHVPAQIPCYAYSDLMNPQQNESLYTSDPINTLRTLEQVTQILIEGKSSADHRVLSISCDLLNKKWTDKLIENGSEKI